MGFFLNYCEQSKKNAEHASPNRALRVCIATYHIIPRSDQNFHCVSHASIHSSLTAFSAANVPLFLTDSVVSSAGIFAARATDWKKSSSLRAGFFSTFAAAPSWLELRNTSTHSSHVTTLTEGPMCLRMVGMRLPQSVKLGLTA